MLRRALGSSSMDKRKTLGDFRGGILKSFCPENKMAHTEVKKQGERAWNGDRSADGGVRACSPARCQHKGREAGGQLVGPLESVVGTPNFASHPLR